MDALNCSSLLFFRQMMIQNESVLNEFALNRSMIQAPTTPAALSAAISASVVSPAMTAKPQSLAPAVFRAAKSFESSS